MDDGLSANVSRIDGVAVVSVAGDVDLNTAAALRTVIDETVETRPLGLVIDLTDVDFLGSVGLSLLVQTRETVGESFAVVADGPATSRPIRLTQLDQVFALHATLADALAALSAP